MTPQEISIRLLGNLQQQLNDEEHEFHIDLKEVDLTDFFHALSNILPNYTYNKFTGNDFNNLEFNHFANQLVFQYIKTK